MSWHYLQGQEEVSSEDISWDGEQFVPSKSKTTLGEYCLPDNETESYPDSPYGMTLRLLMADDGKIGLMWCQGVFPVRTYLAQEQEKGFTDNDQDYGPRWQGSLARYNPASYSWKTAQCSLFGGLEEFSGTWPRWGMMRDGECSPVETRVEFTYESESGLKLPTPRSCTAMSAQITEKTAAAKYPNLETVLAILTLPTIGKNEYKGSSHARFIGSKDFRGAKMSEGLRTCKSDPIYLNPSFAELVMMWPVGWTELKPLATDKFREWLNSHGKSYD